MTHGTEFHGRGGAPAHPGRHRLGGTESWTPPLPPNRAGRRHAAGQAPVDPPVSGSLPLAQPRSGADPVPQAYSRSGTLPGSFPYARPGARPQPIPGSFPYAQPGTLPQQVSGSLPVAQPGSFEQPVSGTLPQPSLPQPRDRRPAPPLFPAAHGDLPLDDEAEPATESPADQAARRTRVSLASPQPRRADTEDDDVLIYAAPPLDGLGGFTIGSVPASVTPPKTWKKAAWFATGASGAVVVGLLFAGSYLVGKPAADQAVQGAWPGYQGAPTVIDPTGPGERTSRQGGSAPGPDTSSSPDQPAGRTSGGGAGPVDGSAPPPADDSSAAPGTTGTATPGTSARPQKPPVTPAQRETPVKSPWWYSFPPDAQTMGDNSEKFFNTVTTDPAAASAVTTGELHDQGPQALADRYAGVAYFEVRKISIDQQRGVTVNTVEITHTDGSKTIEERTLTFGDGDKIAADGQ
ncbi:hypothetical protein SAMN05421837_105816 [Amycolatopsis pretoriensis]|uniref:Uncharacterized protein n=1 Tax=Amycolatopsis pretoriensis TaxID=218821 RepID=A0A1H5R2H2_9PSEU|nr:hypothetical protein [Amycolatopsis pretoriensis]SEF31607.1 hypothetical protein SAMN05421837_105816 [Amycolatopsis pretoriensis]